MATIRGNEAPEYRGPFNLKPGPIVNFNPYELARRASYWPPTRWILSMIYRRHWNHRRGVRFEVQALMDWARAMTYGNDAIEKELAKPSPLLTAIPWR